MVTAIKNATVADGGRTYRADIIIEGEAVAGIEPCGSRCRADSVFDASGCLALPGVIDTHVHFREPGMTEAGDIRSESRAAAAGGVTTYFDMPNTRPPAVTEEELECKFRMAEESSAVNYSFFFGATAGNAAALRRLDGRRVCGVKVFMGSSTGGMLVDDEDALREIFSASRLPVVAHCEDAGIIRENERRARGLYGDDADISLHPAIRSEEACFKSSELAVRLARETGARLHVAHISTSRELALFGGAPDGISAEACLPHLMFSEEDYKTKKALIKCNPAIKSSSDREALRAGLANGKITAVATDHAPHPLSAKAGGALRAASGMPFVQFSLVCMLSLADKGVLPLAKVPQLMSGNPARLFGIERRGAIKEGFFADIVIVRKGTAWTVGKSCILSKCKWSPLEGESFEWRVERTYCNGRCVYDRNEGFRGVCPSGREITFCR